MELRRSPSPYQGLNHPVFDTGPLDNSLSQKALRYVSAPKTGLRGPTDPCTRKRLPRIVPARNTRAHGPCLLRPIYPQPTCQRAASLHPSACKAAKSCTKEYTRWLAHSRGLAKDFPKYLSSPGNCLAIAADSVPLRQDERGVIRVENYLRQPGTAADGLRARLESQSEIAGIVPKAACGMAN